jgi:hypothetical protein
VTRDPVGFVAASGQDFDGVKCEVKNINIAPDGRNNLQMAARRGEEGRASAREEERRAELKRRELEDEEEEEEGKGAKQPRIEMSRQCPYLDTIDRS